jgi:SAM-dependent methyltransferase
LSTNFSLKKSKRKKGPRFADYWRISRSSGFKRAWGYFWENHVFDLLHGTDTAEWKPKSIESSSPSYRHGAHYEASYTSQILRCLAYVSSQLTPCHYAFYDLGCGKGKVLLCATKLGFEQVIGVEYDGTLVEIARYNLAKTGVSAIVIHSDVLDFSNYASRSVFYLGNPFDDVIISRIRKQIEDRVKDAIVIYTYPLYQTQFDNWELLTLLDGPTLHKQSRIFRWRPGDLRI